MFNRLSYFETMERLNEKMGQLKAEFISRDGLRFNERKKTRML